jgi:CHAT domain-containing protein/tetratricopeptide (TPR) repeat protein
VEAASPPDDDLAAWLRALDAASAHNAADMVVAAGSERTTSAARWLLARACSWLSEDGPGRWKEIGDLGALLLRVVERGHGTEFPAGELAQAHARMLIGLGGHLSSPSAAGLSYQQAAREYVSRGKSLPAALAQLGAATVRWGALLDGEQDEIRTQLAAVAAVDPAVGAEVGSPLEDYLRTLRAIAGLRAGTTGGESGRNEPHERNAEAANLFELATSVSLDDVAVGSRLARVADELYTALGEPDDVLVKVGESLLQQRRWSEAVAVLQECHDRRPQDRDITTRLARAYLEVDRWDDARSLLVGLLVDPPGPQDADALQLLQYGAVLRGDPQHQHWQDLLAQVDPSRTITGQLPSPAADNPREPLRAVLRDGELLIGQDLFELPEEERRAHMTAAIVAGSPDGEQLLTELYDSDPALAERVMHLLGLKRVTPEEARIRAHIDAGEEHFRQGRFDDAASEYRAALDIDPDHAAALLWLGDTWYRRGAYELAQAYFEESIAVAPTPMAFRFLADAIRQSGGSRRRVRQCYEEALRLDPSYGGAKVGLQRLDEEERESGPSVAWLGKQALLLAGLQATTADGPLPETAEDEAAVPVPAAPSVSPALRWSDSQSPNPLLRRGDAATAAREPLALSRPLGADEASATSPTSIQDVSSQNTRADSFADGLVHTIAERHPQSIVTVVDDDDAFDQWVAAATPQDVAGAIMLIVMIAFHYHAKDRDLVRWAHWVDRQVQLAEALPADFGPDQNSMELGRDRLLGDAYEAYASVLYTKGRVAEARGWYERALDLLKAEQDARARAGLVGEPEFDRLFSPADPRAVLLESLAGICHELGDDAAAQRYQDEANELDAARPTSESIISGLVTSGNVALGRDDLDTALHFFHSALEQAEERVATQVVSRPLAQALNALGRSHHRLQLHRSALAYFDRTRRLNERSRNAVRLTSDYREIGRVYRDRPDLGDAREAFEQSLLHTSLPGTPADELSWTARDGLTYRITAADRAWESLLDLGSLLEDRGDLAAAAAFLGLAAQIGDIVRASVADDAQRVTVANQRIDAFAALTRIRLRHALAGGPDAAAAAEDAWLASEAMRARSFLDALGDDELVVPAEVTPALAEQEAAALERRRRLMSSGTHDVVFWDDLGRVQAELEAVWDRMLAVAPTTAGYVEVRRSKPAAAVDIRAMITADDRPTVVASLNALGTDRLAVIALRPDTPRPLIASHPADLARLTRFIKENFGTAGRVRELAADLEDLFHYEMQPLTALLAEVSGRNELLVVCPFGALHYVPLAALHVDHTPLVERNPLAVLPSASLARALRTAAGTPPHISAMVFGDPTGDLAGAREEASKVGALFGTEPILGSKVSRAAVSEALTSVGTVHIAAHAHFDAEDPLSSGLRLADGVLTARELITLEAPTLSLVTLSACETGVSQTNPAQELLGLTRALLFAGADSLVVSLWKVSDAATVDIMSAFYSRLQQDAWKVDALQAATLAARDRYGVQRFDQWAGFQLMGEWR